jgi:hypothetical protein
MIGIRTHDLRLDTLVDDLAEMVPAGKLVPMAYRSLGGREFALVVSREDKARYEAMIGEPAVVPVREREQTRPQQDERIVCAADAGIDVEQSSSVACPHHSYWPDSTWRCAVMSRQRHGIYWDGRLTKLFSAGAASYS